MRLLATLTRWTVRQPSHMQRPWLYSVCPSVRIGLHTLITEQRQTTETFISVLFISQSKLLNMVHKHCHRRLHLLWQIKSPKCRLRDVRVGKCYLITTAMRDKDRSLNMITQKLKTHALHWATKQFPRNCDKFYDLGAVLQAFGLSNLLTRCFVVVPFHERSRSGSTSGFLKIETNLSLHIRSQSEQSVLCFTSRVAASYRLSLGCLNATAAAEQ